MAKLQGLLDLLSLKSFAFCLLGLLLYKVIAQIVYYRYFHPLRIYPGPFLGTVTRLWIAWHCWRETELDTLYKLHEKYGSNSSCHGIPSTSITANMTL